jgi:tetratricopeptide (TPR) repeat protein
MNIEDDILIQKYETLLYNKELIYFDADEFDIIIYHYISENRYADALEALIHAELCHPDDIDLALHKIRVMMYLDNFDRAFELLQDLESRESDLFEINLYKGHIYTMNDDIESALMEFNFALEKNSDYEDEELHYIPYILVDHGYFREALIFLHKFIASGVRNAKIFFNAGHCYDKLSDIEKAEEYFEKSLDEDPFDEKTWVALGLLHLNAQKAGKALNAFEYALSINNENHIAILCKSAALMQSGEHDKAIEGLMDALKHSPDNADALCSLGKCYEEIKDMEKAKECYTKIISQEDDFSAPYWGLSKILYTQGNIEAAIQTIDKAIELDPDNEDYLYFRGQCFVSLVSDKNTLKTILQNFLTANESVCEESRDSEFVNKYKKAIFFYNVGDMEECCKYLLESVMFNREGLERFFNLFPKAKEDAYIINYLGKYLK